MLKKYKATNSLILSTSGVRWSDEINEETSHIIKNSDQNQQD